ncbi:inositol monophosphatase family protein [Consotaella aegiceratis]|uniref:inositol monophosphatase family protein n=1 Tax=Consotaella aegiceratis TaxID=3097961 RepID=UPI002F40A7CB
MSDPGPPPASRQTPADTARPHPLASSRTEIPNVMPLPSMSSDREARFALARQLIRDAGAIALDHFRRYRTLDVATKTGPQDTVSAADREVEETIRDAICSRFPDDGLVGEEYGHQSGASRWTWIVDPIDGTGSFLHGLRSWSVVIAVLEAGRPVIGLVLEPCTDRLYWAVEGGGAFCDDHPIAVDAAGCVGNGLTVISAGRAAQARQVGGIIERLLAAGGVYMRSGSAALSLAHVAAGHYVGFFEPHLSPWDCVAGLLIVKEAGGVADDFRLGADWTERRPVFAAAPGAERDLRDIIAV